MKIGFDAKRAFHNFRGLGNYSRTLISNLQKYYPGNSYFAYTPTYNDQRALAFQKTSKALNIVTPEAVLSKKFSAIWRSHFLTPRLIADELSIFHGLHHELPRGIEKSGIKTVVTVHDVLFLRYPQFHGKINCLIYKNKLKHSCSIADRIVAISEQTKNDLIEFLAIPEEKISVVYQSCGDVFFNEITEQQVAEVTSKYVLPEHYLFYIGALTESKNLRMLFNSFIAIANDYPDLHLVLAGHGKLQSNLKAEAKVHGLSERVHFPGFIDQQVLPVLYQKARAFVFPSLFEGFGIPIIEALASGTPVITSEGSCFPEAGGPDSIYVSPSSQEELSAAMIKVIENNELRESMIQKGREYVQRFKPENVTGDTMRIYQELVA